MPSTRATPRRRPQAAMVRAARTIHFEAFLRPKHPRIWCEAQIRPLCWTWWEPLHGTAAVGLFRNLNAAHATRLLRSIDHLLPEYADWPSQPVIIPARIICADTGCATAMSHRDLRRRVRESSPDASCRCRLTQLCRSDGIRTTRYPDCTRISEVPSVNERP